MQSRYVAVLFSEQYNHSQPAFRKLSALQLTSSTVFDFSSNICDHLTFRAHSLLLSLYVSGVKVLQKKNSMATCLCPPAHWPGACLRCWRFTIKYSQGCGNSWPWDAVNTMSHSISPWTHWWKKAAQGVINCRVVWERVVNLMRNHRGTREKKCCYKNINL